MLLSMRLQLYRRSTCPATRRHPASISSKFIGCAHHLQRYQVLLRDDLQSVALR